VHLFDAGQHGLLKAQSHRVLGMHLHKRLGHMHGKARAQAGARHGVPLVTHATRVEHEGPIWRGHIGEPSVADRNKAGTAGGKREGAVAQPLGA
jgi:hypothetical protein